MLSDTYVYFTSALKAARAIHADWVAGKQDNYRIGRGERPKDWVVRFIQWEGKTIRAELVNEELPHDEQQLARVLMGSFTKEAEPCDKFKPARESNR